MIEQTYKQPRQTEITTVYVHRCKEKLKIIMSFSKLAINYDFQAGFPDSVDEIDQLSGRLEAQASCADNINQ